MIKRRKRGAALITVIMIMAVMTILGAAILNVSVHQASYAAYEDKRMQAHYLARSGAEAALKAWEIAPLDNKPTGRCETVYLNNSNQFVSDSLNMKGKFDVTINDIDEFTTQIVSVGTVSNITQTVTVTIKTDTSEITDPEGSTILGSELDWYDNNSGHASPGYHTIGESGKTVLVSDPGLKLTHGEAIYQADAINFTTDIWNFKYPLKLTAGLIIFNKEIRTNRNGSNDGRIIFNVLKSAGVERNDSPGIWGRVKYNSQWYYFKDNQQILTESDFEKLEEISDDDPNLPDSSSRGIISYSVIWNQEIK